MTYQLTVSPDFSPQYLAGWYIFNTWLQRTLGEAVHLELHDSFQDQRKAIDDDGVDIIFANPYDASLLVREKGFIPLTCPADAADEAIVAVADGSAAHCVEELHPGTRIASTDDPDVHMMGMIMLEPADLSPENTTRDTCDTYVLVAKALLQGKADVGFFLDTAFEDLSNLTRSQLRPLVSSQIFLIHHCLMLGPKLAPRADELRSSLLSMQDNDKGLGVLEGLGMKSWRTVESEEMEFLIDLMSTLVD